MTSEHSYTRRTTIGMIAALPVLPLSGQLTAKGVSGSQDLEAAHQAAASRQVAAPGSMADARPRYHIAAPPGGWINDPQRPLKLGGTWTLWALYNPTYPKGGTNWRRWTSKDLVNWQDQGIAIPRNTTANGDVWSGSTVIDADDTAGFGAGALVTLVTMPVPDAGQSCALWYSRDGGASFTFHAIVLPNIGGHKDFRDPTVFWHASSRRWIMTLSEVGKISIYTSPNLKQWKYASGFVSDDVGRVMECSHLFKLHLYDEEGQISEDKWILLVGGNGTRNGFTVGTYYWVGDFDGTAFTSSSREGQWLDGGADFYAAVVWTNPAAADPLASAYSIAWMSNWDYVNQTPVMRGYQGQLSLVRQLRLQALKGVPRLVSTPLDAQNAVFDSLVIGSDQTIGDGLAYTWPKAANATSYRLDFLLHRIGQSWPAEVELLVRKGKRFFTKITFALRNNTALLSRAKSGPDTPNLAVWRQDRRVICNFSSGTAKVSLFVDSGSVELFLNNGLETMSQLITAPVDAVGLQLSSFQGSVTVSDLTIRKLADHLSPLR